MIDGDVSQNEEFVIAIMSAIIYASGKESSHEAAVTSALGLMAARKAAIDNLHETSRHEKLERIRSRPISELDLQHRARRCMNNLGINTVGGLCEKTDLEILKCYGVGRTVLKEIEDKLKYFSEGRLALKERF